MSDKKLITMDGNEAAAYVAYALSEVAAIYPITPSSPMAEKTDAWAAKDKKNIFDQTVKLIEMQSEAGAAAAIHGALETGCLATSFTSSQGLMLMIPVMHRLSGQRHPAVLHVASRTVGTHAFSIFGDHSDVMNCRQTGFAMLSTANAQEIMDLAGVAHLSAIKTRVPFMHFFDGFRTSHEVSKVECIEYDTLKSMVDYEALEEFRAHALNPEHPLLRSTVQNPDIYFQIREANNRFYSAVPAVVEEYMQKINQVTGREYHLFNYYGASDAEEVIVAMGSVSGTIMETVDYLNSMGRKVGFVQIHLFRPFSFEHFFEALPKTVKKIAVLDRCKEMGAAGDPIYQDICTAFANKKSDVLIVGGRYGLSSKDTDPAQIKAVYDNLSSDMPKNNFSIGIIDDVTHLSLPIEKPIYPDADKALCFKFWGLGSDGTVGANKNTVDIINEHTTKYGQAYFEYDAKKSFGVTKSHLRFEDVPIRSSYFIKHADLIGCHNQTYIQKYDIVSELKNGGTLLLNCSWTIDEIEKMLPAKVKYQLAEKQAKLYIIDATKIATSLGLGNHTNIVLQSAFFRLANLIPFSEAEEYMKNAVKKTYFKKGDDVVNKNLAAVDSGSENIKQVNVPQSWLNCKDDTIPNKNVPKVVTNLLEPINNQKGDELPVSAFVGYEDGAIDMGLTAFEKRGIAVKVPVWDSTKCIQCNKCSFVCPHAVIRPYLLNQSEKENAPEGFKTTKAIGAKEFEYSLQISALDCTGCGSCVECCPAKEKAITMVPLEQSDYSPDNWYYGLTVEEKDEIFKRFSVKGSQFKQPLLEFSAACAGCGETPYAKLLTQLFGERVYWANATGCSQAWGSPMPGIPYTTNKKGFGPAWSNSLFENNAEFSLGMLLSVRQQRENVKMQVEKLKSMTSNQSVIDSADAWISQYENFDNSAVTGEKLVETLSSAMSNLTEQEQKVCDVILKHKDQLSKKSFWMFGGDGWAYDIGFGGLDHVLAQGENINAFVVDTELYSNTGGQSSKATPLGAVAQFCASGKGRPKKDLGAMFMSYGNVYVAQVAMGADSSQLIKAIKEAEEFNGPSLIIAYTPCVAHGIKGGMHKVQNEMKLAVDSGYWNLYRYNPMAETKLVVDSKEPIMDLTDFFDGENRYASLKRTFPNNAENYFGTSVNEAKEKFEHFKKLEENQ